LWVFGQELAGHRHAIPHELNLPAEIGQDEMFLILYNHHVAWHQGGGIDGTRTKSGKADFIPADCYEKHG
jgi:hypothetical protein